MRKAWFYVLLTGFVLIFAPKAASAAVAINEVLFDPSGSDTGFEKIELHNAADAAIGIGGWQLYPDGIGYYSFPQGFEIAGKSSVVVHLRSSGTDDTKNLYHSTATGNMGNSSGSIALFTGEPRGKDTIVDFVRYHKPGSSERKTWESAAAEASLWTTGQFIDTTGFQEGNALALITDGVRGGPSLWEIVLPVAFETIGTSSQAAEAATDNEEVSGLEATSVSSGSAVFPSLDAYAGDDRVVFQGAAVDFRGSARGIDKGPLTAGRFFWNFGDGTTREGKIVSHTYYFPGTYGVSFNVSSGEYSGSDYAKIKVINPALFISEAKSGERGFLEVYNDTAYRLDLGGFQFEGGAARFAIEKNTFIEPKLAVVFPNAVSGLLWNGSYIVLKNALGEVIDSGDFKEPLLIEESFSRVSFADGGQKFVKISPPTPGAYESSAGIRGEIEERDNAQPLLPRVTSEGVSVDSDITSLGLEPGVNEEENKSAAQQEGTAAVSASPRVFSFWFLTASIVIGVFAAVGFLIIRFK